MQPGKWVTVHGRFLVAAEHNRADYPIVKDARVKVERQAFCAPLEQQGNCSESPAEAAGRSRLRMSASGAKRTSVVIFPVAAGPDWPPKATRNTAGLFPVRRRLVLSPDALLAYSGTVIGISG